MGQGRPRLAFELAFVAKPHCKNQALLAMADELEAQQDVILAGTPKTLKLGGFRFDRCHAGPSAAERIRLAGIVADVRKVVTLDDPGGC